MFGGEMQETVVTMNIVPTLGMHVRQRPEGDIIRQNQIPTTSGTDVDSEDIHIWEGNHDRIPSALNDMSNNVKSSVSQSQTMKHAATNNQGGLTPDLLPVLSISEEITTIKSLSDDDAHFNNFDSNQRTTDTTTETLCSCSTIVSNCVSLEANPQEDSIDHYSMSQYKCSDNDNSLVVTIDSKIEDKVKCCRDKQELIVVPIRPNHDDSYYHEQNQATSLSQSICKVNHSTRKRPRADFIENVHELPSLNAPINTQASILDNNCSKANHIQVGSRVSVYWDGEKKYFKGTVIKEVFGKKKPYYVKYDDGDKEWVDFSSERYNVLDALDNPIKHAADDIVKLSMDNERKCVDDDWVSAGICKADSDSDTDEEELNQWAIKMFGIPQVIARPKITSDANLHNVGIAPFNDVFDRPMSISEKVKLGRRSCTSAPSYTPTPPQKKQSKEPIKSKSNKLHSQTEKSTFDDDMKLRKEQARPLTAAEIRSILCEDAPSTTSSSWVRRSVRQPSKSVLTAPRVKALLEMLVSNDSDMIVLKMKKYCSDLDTPSLVIDAVLDALEENTNCEALYIQNFNEGMRDEQVLHLLRILQRPSCKIWCLNIGETYKVQMKTWEKFTKGLAETKITHMYASEHTITSELKEQIRETIRTNRSKHHLHDDPSNLDTIVQCTHCWWNPINAKSLRPYIQRKGYEHMLADTEAQGLRGSMSGAFLS